jgi:hypothetical protein
VVVHNEEGMFQLKGALTRRCQPLRVLDFDVQPLMLSKTIVEWSWIDQHDLDPCPYHILTSMGGLEKAQRLTKQEIMIEVNLNKPTNYTIVQAQTMVTHATSYDMLVGGVVLYPLRVTIDFWEETAYYHLGW